MITKEQVLEAQEKWGSGVVKIGALKETRTECETFASAFLDARYAFDKTEVLFKPTKCELEQFRPSKAEALKKWPEPTCRDDLVSFLAYANFIREYIPDLHQHSSV